MIPFSVFIPSLIFLALGLVIKAPAELVLLVVGMTLLMSISRFLSARAMEEDIKNIAIKSAVLDRCPPHKWIGGDSGMKCSICGLKAGE